ncbi:MAG: LysM peptidoglycan-binding domain-containing protein [Calditrichales bacterium]|nr:LysM peptidoglycan-binding domain-containing protein [Calditrichales bacterium]
MKKSIINLILLVSVFAFSSVFAQTSYNYEEMKQEEYNAYLADWQQKLDNANQGIEAEDSTSAALKKQTEDLQAQIDKTWDEIFQITNSNREEYDAYVNNLKQLKNDASSLLSLSPEDIYRRMNEVDELQAKVAETKKNPFSVMTDNAQLISSIESMLAQAKEKGKPAIPPTYSVLRGDCLWRIASKADIYGDAYAWMRIYTSNRDQIKNPDLIYVNQIFNIPRDVGPNEHLVIKGEFLSKIAGYSNVYGSSFKWQRLYESNKSTISDPNMIYPYQLLKIAR